MAEYEPNVNARLRDLLRQTGLSAKAEHKVGGGRRVDIMVRLDAYMVAIECELVGGQNEPAKKKEAVRDARSRLFPKPVADVAIAVVYPRGTTESLQMDDTVSYAVVGAEEAVGTSTQMRLDGAVPNRKAASWGECTVKQLANVVRSIGRDLGDPDVLVTELKRSLDTAVDLLSDAELKNTAKSLHLDFDRNYRPAAKRALLVVASAAMFHARLDEHLAGMRPDIDARNGNPYAGAWPPETLHACFDTDNIPVALLDAWDLILAVDYKPIFEAGRAVLQSSNSHRFTEAVKYVVQWARDAVGRVAGLRHDILGRIFHAVLGTARYDGSFYTGMPAAVLLSGLAIRDKNDMPTNFSDMRIMDPACGTGTLLMATAERVRDVLGNDCDSTTLIEKVLAGVDINVTALHMAATTLGLLSPTTQFRRMDIRQLQLGKVSDNKPLKSGKLAGTISAGSLELYDEGGLDAYFGWSERGSANVESGEKRAAHTYKHSIDHIIMNPPFTRHDIRHDQLGEAVEKLVKRREAEIFENAPVDPDKTSSGPMFLVLAEHLAKQNSTVSLVLPLVASMNPSTAKLRLFLAERFHIDTIVVPHDPKRFWFSENTRVSEMLVVMRRRKNWAAARPSTRIVHLAVNPNTVTDAMLLASDIRNSIPRNDMQVVEWPYSRVVQGDWSGVQFFSPYLVERFRMMRDGEMFQVAQLGEIADVGPNGRTITMYMKQSDAPNKYGWRSIYGNETGRITSMQAKPYTYVVPKPAKIKAAESFWSKRATLLLPERIQPNIARAAAINSTQPTVGTSWTGVRPRGKGGAAWSKAMSVYLNSTLGIIALLGVRIPRKLMYPRYSLEENQRRVPVPVLSKAQTLLLTRAYDKTATKTLGLWRDCSDPVRTNVDNVVSKALGLDPEVVHNLRFELSREPMVTGKQYGQ